MKTALEIDLDGYQLRCGDRLQPLTKKERETLAVLVQNAGQTVAREEILDCVWGRDSEVGFASVDNVIARLRSRFGMLNPEQQWIETVRGVGYRWNGPTSPLTKQDGRAHLILRRCTQSEQT